MHFLRCLRPITAPQDRHAPVHAKPKAPKLRLRLELLEDRIVPSSVYRSIDGTGNNPLPANFNFGAAGTDLIRIALSAYADGKSAPAGSNRPSARDISNLLSDQTDPHNTSQDLDIPNQKQLSDFIYVFGQFLDHDLDLTTANTGQTFDIPATQPGDPFNPPGFIPFTRSDYNSHTGTTKPRQQINAITAFIDGSQIYGSTTAVASALRTFHGGRLKTTQYGPGTTGEFLPLDNGTNFPLGTIPMANDAHIVQDSALFAAGDVRANENIKLTSVQTLFLREHNRIADLIHGAYPFLSDEQIYQAARKIVGAELQIIVYNEWIPALLGPNALPVYTGYKPNANPGIANEFSTAMFRFAHSQLDNGIDRLNNDGTDIADGGVDLAHAFFNPTLINPNGVLDGFSGHISTNIDPILKGAASGNAQEVDLLAVRDVRNLLFGPPGSGGSDLIARDIQRSRDHGLTDYNSMRAAYHLPKVKSFAQITSNFEIQNKLQQLYGTVDNIDVFVGALAEDHVPGADVGPLTKAVLVDQFTRLRDGDRFFYLNNQFSPLQLDALLATTSLAKVIERNTSITNLQENVFFFKASITGHVFFDRNHDGHFNFGEHGLAGQTVQLLDSTNTVIATATTGFDGSYHFDKLAMGVYTVRVEVPAGYTLTTPGTRSAQITRGQTIDDQDFGLLPIPSVGITASHHHDLWGTWGGAWDNASDWF